MAHAAKWVAASKLIGQILTFSTTLLLARILDKEDFGLFALALLYTWLIDNLIDFGFQSALIQTKDLSEQTLSGVFWFLTAISIITVAVSWAAAEPIAVFWGEPELAAIVRWMSIAFLSIPAAIIGNALLIRRMDLPRVSRAELAAGILRCGVVLILAWAGAGLMSLIYGYVAERIAVALLLLCACRWLPEIKYTSKGIRALLSFGLRVTGARLLWLAYSRLDTLIVGKLLGTAILGTYTVAAQLAFAFPQFISSAFYRLVFPVLSRISDKRLFADSFSELAGHLSLICVPVMLIISVNAVSLVDVLLGDKWQDAAQVLSVLSIAGLFNILTGLLPQATNAAGHPEMGMWANFLTILVFSVAFYYSGLSFGLAGILFCWIVLAPIKFIATVYAACVILDIRPTDYWQTQLGAWIGGLTLTVTGFTLNAYVPEEFSIIRIALTSVCGAGIYFLIASRLNPEQMGKLLALLQQSISRARHAN